MNEKEVVLRYVEAFNRGDLDAVCSTFAPDAHVWGVLGSAPVDQARSVWADLIDCLEMNLTVEGIIQEGKTVAVRYTERGRSAKQFRGMGPTGKTYEVAAMEWFEVEDGLIRRRWGARDFAAMSRQLGFTH